MKILRYDTIQLSAEDIRACVVQTMRRMGYEVQPHNVMFMHYNSETPIAIKSRAYFVDKLPTPEQLAKAEPGEEAEICEMTVS